MDKEDDYRDDYGRHKEYYNQEYPTSRKSYNDDYGQSYRGRYDDTNKKSASIDRYDHDVGDYYQHRGDDLDFRPSDKYEPSHDYGSEKYYGSTKEYSSDKYHEPSHDHGSDHYHGSSQNYVEDRYGDTSREYSPDTYHSSNRDYGEEHYHRESRDYPQDRYHGPDEDYPPENHDGSSESYISTDYVPDKYHKTSKSWVDYRDHGSSRYIPKGKITTMTESVVGDRYDGDTGGGYSPKKYRSNRRDYNSERYHGNTRFTGGNSNDCEYCEDHYKPYRTGKQNRKYRNTQDRGIRVRNKGESSYRPTTQYSEYDSGNYGNGEDDYYDYGSSTTESNEYRKYDDSDEDYGMSKYIDTEYVPENGGKSFQYQDGVHRSFSNSYNMIPGEPVSPYNPSEWARWEGGGTNSRSNSRSSSRDRSGGSRDLRYAGSRSSTGYSDMSEDSGDGTTTTITEQHIVHHYKPEDKKKSHSKEDRSVLGVIQKHLPRLPWPFNGVRRMGVDEEDVILIDTDVKEGSGRKYPDSIQSILETMEGANSRADTVVYPFLEDNYKFVESERNGDI